MSFKTYKNCINIEDTIYITFSNISNKLDKLDKLDKFKLLYPEFNNLLIFSDIPNMTKQHIITIIDKYINIGNFKLLKKGIILNDTENNYTLDNITYKNIFSEFLPEIPVIVLEKNNILTSNNCIFYKKDPIGITVNNTIVIPFIFLFILIKNLIINDGIYILDNQLVFDIIETINDEDKQAHFFLVLNESISINTPDHKKFKISQGDIVFNINGDRFNKNGRIYSNKLNLFLPINSYLMLEGHNNISFNFLPKSKIKTTDKLTDYDSKTVNIKLPIFKQENLKIPIFQDDKKYIFNDLKFSILTEKLMEKYMDCPISHKHFQRNHISYNKYIVLTNHNTGKLFVLKKISNKKIHNFEEMIEYINKTENKKTFYFERADQSIKITI
jgi:hypothetical protein